MDFVCVTSAKAGDASITISFMNEILIKCRALRLSTKFNLEFFSLVVRLAEEAKRKKLKNFPFMKNIFFLRCCFVTLEMGRTMSQLL